MNYLVTSEEGLKSNALVFFFFFSNPSDKFFGVPKDVCTRVLSEMYAASMEGSCYTENSQLFLKLPVGGGGGVPR